MKTSQNALPIPSVRGDDLNRIYGREKIKYPITQTYIILKCML